MVTAIESGAVYVPPDRLATDPITRRWHSNSGDVETKAVPRAGETVLTMGEEAARRAIRAAGVSVVDVDAVLLASTSARQRVPELSAELVTLLDGPRDAFTADLRGSPRAGVGALVTAAGLDESLAERILVVAGDLPYGPPGSRPEATTGGGAAAVLLSEDGSANVSQTATGTTGFAAETGSREETRWVADERFARERYEEALESAFDRHSADVAVGEGLRRDVDGGFDHASLQGPLGTADSVPANRLDGVQEHAGPIVREVGDVRTAGPLLGLCRALDRCDGDERIVVLGYGGGGYHLLSIETPGSVPTAGLADLSSGEANRAPDYLEYLDRTGRLGKDT